MSESFIQSSLSKEDTTFEVPLRPQYLDEFIGQKEIIDRLEVFMQAAKERQETLGHCLFYGPAGLGKTTLSSIIAKTMQTNLVTTSGPVIEKPGDLAGILTNLQRGDVLFIDEIHRINRNIEEYLYSAMEDFTLDLMIDSGPSARSVQIQLNPFTLVGATTQLGLLSNPLRSRFAMICRLEFYTPEHLTKIVQRSAKILRLHLDEASSLEIAKRSRGTPRIANNLLRWVRDYVQIKAANMFSLPVVDQALNMLAIDHLGLDEVDKKILKIMIEHHNGGPVGLNTVAIALGEDPTTLAEVYEPYLILKGLIKRTPRGRQLTPLAYKHLKKSLPSDFKEELH